MDGPYLETRLANVWEANHLKEMGLSCIGMVSHREAEPPTESQALSEINRIFNKEAGRFTKSKASNKEVGLSHERQTSELVYEPEIQFKYYLFKAI